MDTFAEYILEEKNLGSKMEITYYLAKKAGIFFDESTIFKVELARMFLIATDIDVDHNLLLTACLLANCKKIDVALDREQLTSYAKNGAEYLYGLGFSKHFCKICEEINRYSDSNPREKESDILELVDQFGGMLLDRPERIGLKPDEALVLLEHRNLKGKYNRYLQSFIDFVEATEKLFIKDVLEISPLRLLVKMRKEAQDVKHFITDITYEFGPKVDEVLNQCRDEVCQKRMTSLSAKNPNRTLFTEETTQKIIGKLV